MSGFQIPGLGQAKPNETLPPLAENADIAVAAKYAEDQEMGDTQPTPRESKPSASDAAQGNMADSTSNQAMATEETTGDDPTGDSMAIDRPASPPSLTSALEAAIGGLGDTVMSQPQAPAAAGQMVELQNDQGDNPEWEVDSNPYESSSDTTSSDSSDDDDDDEGYELLGVEETARMLMEAEGGSDDEGDKSGKGSSAAQLRTKNELAEQAIPKPDVTITPEMRIEELGEIQHIVENMVLIKGATPGEYQVLDTGSVLCDANRVVVGAVAETIGKVLQPMYTLHLSSEQELNELGLQVGTKLYYPVDHAAYVFTEPLKNLKGSDASNLHDEEVGDEEMEFSDDEKEAEHKRAIKQKKKDKWKTNAGAGGGRGGREPHPLRQETQPDGGLNYDDDDDGPYKPLTRPPGFGSGPVSTESIELPPRSNFNRGGGRRGDGRGRGGRGRGHGRGGRGGGHHSQHKDGYSQPPQGGHQHPSQQPNPSGWNNGSSSSNPSAPSGSAAPAMPNFPFQIPGWPQAPPPPQQHGHPAPPPPPPPGWPAQGGQGQGQGAPAGAFNPAFFAALMGQMQQAQGGQSGSWGGQQQPPPPNGGHGQ